MMIVIVRTGPYILARVLCSCRPVIQLSLASTLPQTRLCICWPRFDFSSMKEIINQETGCKRNDSHFQLMIFQAIFVILQPRSQGLSSLPSLVVGTETLVAAGHVILVYICARALDLVLLLSTIFA